MASPWCRPVLSLDFEFTYCYCLVHYPVEIKHYKSQIRIRISVGSLYFLTEHFIGPMAFSGKSSMCTLSFAFQTWERQHWKSKISFSSFNDVVLLL